MSAQLIDGKAIAADIRADLREQVQRLPMQPGLATVLVGARPDSVTYVNMKHRACAEVGVRSVRVELPESVSEAELVGRVRELNADPQVHGILVQLPLPPHIDEERALAQVSLEKDVDGFHPVNIGRLAMKNRDPLFVPCTPLGCIELLKRSGTTIAGRQAVVLGRSNIVGLPVALLLLRENATVTVCHSHTPDVAAVVRQADILVAAIGKPEYVQADWLRPGVTVIDVGINQKPDASSARGYRLVGDVDFDACRRVAGQITPVPGGTGPMTIAMLLRNTVRAAQRQLQNG